MPVSLELFTEAMESIAPKALALEWDNVGLLIEPVKNELDTILVALDPTPEVALEAVRIGAQLLLTHHPILMGGVKRITREDPETRAAWILLSNGVGHFAAHTNLDEAPGGVNDELAKRLGLVDIARLSETDAAAAPMRLGRLSAPEALSAFSRRVDAALGVESRFAGEPERKVEKIAVCGGAGMSLIEHAVKAGADAYVTADIKHHQALNARSLGVALVDATHDYSERVVLAPLLNRLQARFDALQCILTLKCSTEERGVFRRA